MSIERRYALLGHIHSVFADAVTFNGTVDFNGAVTVDAIATFSVQPVFDAGIQLNDNDKAFFGTGDDLQIYHDGTNNFIDSVNGTLILRAMAAGSHMHVHGNDTIPWFDFHAIAATELIVGDGTNSTSTRLTIDGPAATNRELRFETNGSLRWDIRAENTAESGSNAGSLLEILARQDDGTASYTLLSATRATAQIGLVGGVGTTTNPNWGFVGDLNTGVMRPAADEISLVAGGTETLAVTATDVTITGDVIVTGSISAASTDGERSAGLLADSVVTSDTTYNTLLSLTNVVPGSYIFEAFAFTECSAVPDLKQRWTFSGTATDVGMNFNTQGVATGSGLMTAFSTERQQTVTGTHGMTVSGCFTVTATGTLAWEGAQITSSATAITFYKGSWMRIRRLG